MGTPATVHIAVVGGCQKGSDGVSVGDGSSVEVFDAVSRNIRSFGNLHQRRGGHASALLTGDRVLVVGGWIARHTYTFTAELVAISSGSVTEAAQLPVALHAMDAVTLADGRVLVTGGQIEGGEGTERCVDIRRAVRFLVGDRPDDRAAIQARFGPST